jgi:hypothetical protein
MLCYYLFLTAHSILCLLAAPARQMTLKVTQAMARHQIAREVVCAPVHKLATFALALVMAMHDQNLPMQDMTSCACCVLPDCNASTL